MLSLQYLSVLTVLAPAAFALSLSSRANDTSCCTILADALPDALYMPDSAIYQSTNDRYFTEAQALLEPECRVLPSNAEEVSQIVKIAAENSCKFAVASGKHWAIPGGSNIGPEGFTIDLANLNTTSLSADGKVGSVGPGVRGGAVYDYFNQFNVYVGVGRDSDVGTGGFLLGGGISFISFEHGLGSNTVQNYEIVLSSGEIANANETSNPDLFWALKFGSTNYGIITRFDMIAYPLPQQIWAGIQTFSLEKESDALLSRWSNFTTYLSGHTDEAGVVLLTFNQSSEDFQIIQGYYRDGEEHPPMWQTLVGDDIQPDLDAMAVKSFPQFLEEIRQVSFVPKTIWKDYTVKSNGTYALALWRKGVELFNELNATAEIPGLTYDMSIQPLLNNSRCATFAGPACDGSEGDSLLILTRVFWDVNGDEGDQQVHDLMQTWEDWATEESKELGIYEEFRYINYDGSPDDDPYLSLPAATLTKMQEIRAKYDPDNVYVDLWKGGFKMPSA